MGGPGLAWNLNGNRNAKLQHWPVGALGFSLRSGAK